jgi:hypothetical protein
MGAKLNGQYGSNRRAAMDGLDKNYFMLSISSIRELLSKLQSRASAHTH